MRNEQAAAQSLEVKSDAWHRDRPIFRDVFETELAFVWNSLRRFGIFERDLEDVAHEVFVVVARRLAEFDPTRPLRPWLFAIAFRTASDHRRRARHRYEHLSGEPIERADPGTRADDLLVRNEEQNLARRALLGVPEERRTVLILHDFEDVAMSDIADALGVPLKTAYSRLRVGREELIAHARHLEKEQR